MSTDLYTPLTGWGRTAPSSAHLVDVRAADLAATLDGAGERGAVARGLGRSYGDPAQNGGGLVVRLTASAHEVELDTATGAATLPAGLSIDELLRLTVPLGFFVPVTPGTRFVTIGGAIASDVHGKNHHSDGSFGNHLIQLRLMLADGSVVVASPTERAELFWATVGGMGLTGVIVDATVRLLPIETSQLMVETSRVGHLDDLLTTMVDGDSGYRYSVAWIDLMATGANLGRSVLTRGDHAVVADLPGNDRHSALHYDPRHLASIPDVVPPPGLINPFTVSVFNEVWFRKAPKRPRFGLESLTGFFHPLDMVGSWNRVYGPAGMVQLQFVVPRGQEAVLRKVIERLAATRAPCFLAVLKQFGAANAAPLSFPMPGWTLALDVPARTPHLADLLHEFDSMVLDAGGRHYLAKDAHVTPETFRRGYPRLSEWQAIRRSVDPDGRWQSDLARRLLLL